MNNIRMLVFGRHFLFFVLAAAAVNANAEDKDCWADFFGEVNYAGKPLHLTGPTQLETLDKVQGENWNERIHSLKVGPKAKVTVYKNPKFELTVTKMAQSPEQMQALGITVKDIKEDSELIFNENATIHNISDFNFHKKIKSLKVDCL